MGGKKPGPRGKGAAVMPLLAQPTDAAADDDVDEDDVAFIQSHRRQLQRLVNAQLEEAPCVHVLRRPEVLSPHASDAFAA